MRPSVDLVIGAVTLGRNAPHPDVFTWVEEAKPMRKVLLGLGVLAAVALTTPRLADAHVSVAIGLPGFGFFVEGPPVVYTPPVVYAPRVYRPFYPRVIYDRPYFHDHGCHRGWYKHDWDDDQGEDD